MDSTICRAHQHAAGARRDRQAQKEPLGGTHHHLPKNGLGLLIALLCGNHGLLSVHRWGRSMEADGLASVVMSALTGLASGAGTGLGTAATDEVRRLARERLSSSGGGSATLAQLDEAPSAPGVQEEARAYLATAITSDPEFARKLLEVLQPTHVRAGSDINTITIGGGVKKSTITIGPVTLQNTPGVRASLTAIVAALAVLIALLLYEGVRGLTDDGTDKPSSLGASGGNGSNPGALSGGGGGTARKKLPITERGHLEAVLPGVDSILSGWSLKTPADTFSGKACTTSCAGLLWESRVTFTDPGVNNVAVFRVLSYRTEKAAEAGYKDFLTGAAEPTDDGLQSRAMSMSAVGEQTAAFATEGFRGNATTYQMASINRAGTVVSRIVYGGGTRELDTNVLLAFTRMIDERARQAQNGETPTAVASLS
ncbi:hypothetical protein ACWCYK_11910 [Streptomyces lydicamycinicus]|uniref:hypothetical protein n=1 Tax=Streptomyces lydicamycinicus TaxID=1546107 RepID=UPI001FDF909D|nr:hypothetical protein [Streptomyces lydicamycinicus]